MVEDQVPAALGQRSATVRFEWSPVGAAAISESDGCVIIVDVLSFTTAVSVATGRGMAIYPYAFGAPGIETFAASHSADLAVRRRDVSPGHPWSLSPVTLSRAPVTARLVLPSPNGSAIAAAASGTVVAGCLRNTSAVATWALDHGYGAAGHPIGVVAAGERWPDGSLRPAIEDALGAGAILSWLGGTGLDLSSEALTMAAVYDATPRVDETIWDCASALELLSIGYEGDVELALESDVDGHVPVLTNGAFCAE